MEANEIEKKNIEIDIDDEQLKLKLEFENDKNKLVSEDLRMRRGKFARFF